MKVIILTGSELRHDFVRKSIALDKDIEVLRTYCEESEKTFLNKIDKTNQLAQLQFDHIKARKYSEYDFFNHFVALTPDASRPLLIEKGEINTSKCFDEILDLKPDLLVAYGCSLIKGPLLSEFTGRFLNVHLGLSPYYRGAGTNFWPLVNKEPQLVGATFMHIDTNIDTGEIIHQIRARIHPEDTPHLIGNRLIADMAYVYIDVIKKFDKANRMEQLPMPKVVKLYHIKDFSPESVQILYRNFENNLVDSYLKDQEELIKRVPIIENPAIVKGTQE